MELLCFKPFSSLEQYSLRQHCPRDISAVMELFQEASLGKQAATGSEGGDRYEVRKVGELGLRVHVQ